MRHPTHIERLEDHVKLEVANLLLERRLLDVSRPLVQYTTCNCTRYDDATTTLLHIPFASSISVLKPNSQVLRFELGSVYNVRAYNFHMCVLFNGFRLIDLSLAYMYIYVCVRLPHHHVFIENKWNSYSSHT